MKIVKISLLILITLSAPANKAAERGSLLRRALQTNYQSTAASDAPYLQLTNDPAIETVADLEIIEEAACAQAEIAHDLMIEALAAEVAAEYIDQRVAQLVVNHAYLLKQDLERRNSQERKENGYRDTMINRINIVANALSEIIATNKDIIESMKGSHFIGALRGIVDAYYTRSKAVDAILNAPQTGVSRLLHGKYSQQQKDLITFDVIVLEGLPAKFKENIAAMQRRERGERRTERRATSVTPEQRADFLRYLKAEQEDMFS